MDIAALLADSVLFRDVSRATLSLAARSPAASFGRGEPIPSGSLGFVLSGTVQAVGAAPEKAPTLNTFRQGDFFGMASLFGAPCSTTRLKAAGPCRVLLLPQALLEQLLQSDPVFARNYAAFLTDKIRFLNRKIAAFTAGSAEKALARYLLSLPVDGNVVILPMSLSALASALCIARSSLYRAFDALEENALLSREQTRVTFASRDEFSELYGGL